MARGRGLPDTRDTKLGPPSGAPTGVPNLMDLPVTLLAGASWFPLAGTLSALSIGPMTISALLSGALAALLASWLPAYGGRSSAAVSASLGPLRISSTVPLLLWAFVALTTISSVAAGLRGNLSIGAVQNAVLYLLFVGAIAASAASRSQRVVIRGWDLLRTVSTWSTYSWLVILASGIPLPLANRSIGMMTTIIVALLVSAPPRNSWERFAPYAAVLVAVLSLSRTATLTSLALLSFIAVRRTRQLSLARGRLAKAYFFLAVGLAAATLAFMLYPPLRDRFLVGDNAVRYGNLAFSTSGRSKIWELLLSSQQNRWFGHGPGAAAQLVQESTGVEHPHNEYIRFYYDFGIVGLAFFVAGYIVLAWRVLRNARRSDHPLHWAAFASLVGIGILAFTDNCFVYPYVILALGSLAGLSLALSCFEFSDRFKNWDT